MNVKYEWRLKWLELNLCMGNIGFYISAHLVLTWKLLTLTLTTNNNNAHETLSWVFIIFHARVFNLLMNKCYSNVWIFPTLTPFEYECKLWVRITSLWLDWKWSCMNIYIWKTDVHHQSKVWQNSKKVNEDMHSLIRLHAWVNFAL